MSGFNLTEEGLTSEPSAMWGHVLQTAFIIIYTAALKRFFFSPLAITCHRTWCGGDIWCALYLLKWVHVSLWLRVSNLARLEKQALSSSPLQACLCTVVKDGANPLCLWAAMLMRLTFVRWLLPSRWRLLMAANANQWHSSLFKWAVKFAQCFLPPGQT